MATELHQVPRLFYETPQAFLVISSNSLVAWTHPPLDSDCHRGRQVLLQSHHSAQVAVLGSVHHAKPALTDSGLNHIFTQFCPGQQPFP